MLSYVCIVAGLFLVTSEFKSHWACDQKVYVMHICHPSISTEPLLSKGLCVARMGGREPEMEM